MINFLKSIFKLKNNKIKTINSVNTRLLEFIDKRKIENVTLFDVNETNLKQYPIFDLGENTVIYFEKEISNKTDEYIRNNFSNIKNEFLNRGRNFYYLPILLENIDFEILPALKSTFPFLSDDFNKLIIDELKTAKFDYDTILLDFIKFIVYNGTISKGCISRNDGYTIVEQKNEESIVKFFEGYIENLNINNSYSGIRFYSLKKDSNREKDIENQTFESLNIISKEIEQLRKSGQLAILAPKIYEFLMNNIDGIIYNDIYPMVISEDCKILIPECNNLEIKLSHLTKAIYLLFLSNHEPIDLKDLHLHKDRLLFIYKQVSNQNSYDKIKKSVEELLNGDNEAIYVHFSRIKKAFVSHFSPYKAVVYYITGEKSKPKQIIFDRNYVTFNCNIF